MLAVSSLYLTLNSRQTDASPGWAPPPAFALIPLREDCSRHSAHLILCNFARPAEETWNQILASVREFTGDVEAAGCQTVPVIRKSAA